MHSFVPISLILIVFTASLTLCASAQTNHSDGTMLTERLPGPPLSYDEQPTGSPDATGSQNQGGEGHLVAEPVTRIAPAPTNESIGVEKPVQKVGNAWVVPGAGSFSNRAVYTFQGSTLPSGLMASDYTVACRETKPPIRIPYNEKFQPKNVRCAHGVLNLIVPGGQKPQKQSDRAVSCAEITTVESNILHASVRTVAQFSKVFGTCHGLFFYRDDTQEIDIEYLTDPTSQSNAGPDMPIPIWYTNQAVPGEVEATDQTGPSPFDCTTNMHEYRCDWTENFTAFYLDGVLQQKFTTNVPTEPGSWVWNNWANGDKGWSVGPPQTDSILQIQSITMYYNTTDPECLSASKGKSADGK